MRERENVQGCSLHDEGCRRGRRTEGRVQTRRVEEKGRTRGSMQTVELRRLRGLTTTTSATVPDDSNDDDGDG